MIPGLVMKYLNGERLLISEGYKSLRTHQAKLI